jgi:hypothetical protein
MMTRGTMLLGGTVTRSGKAPCKGGETKTVWGKNMDDALCTGPETIAAAWLSSFLMPLDRLSDAITRQP